MPELTLTEWLLICIVVMLFVGEISQRRNVNDILATLNGIRRELKK